MDNKNDWKELEKEQGIKDSSIIQQYGFDIKKYTEKTFSKKGLERRRKINILIKISIPLIILFIIFIQINSVNIKLKARTIENIKSFIKLSGVDDVEIIWQKTY